MSALFASGRIIDLILALTLCEAIAVLVYRRRTGRGPAPFGFLVNLASGACLLLALRTALTGAGWAATALCLLGALAAHLLDLTARWHTRG